ncbi:ribosomal RNA small subunit methyltransferase I [Tianweitania populi]|uniref:Ribosomal RNA small subunit methyltransferase I n=1 Tax=Tianweitania populi TaxID=1607949 RepID=A0A8J3DXP3_9HYPH|nr:ribosomal RNA small subunit methyltransferase I [Tianweitania populi]
MQDEVEAPKSFMIGQTAMPTRPLEPALYIVSTPIGNLGDITLRALETLAAADILACEDTRVTRVLLDRYGIRRRAFAYHEHNESEATPRLVEAIASGKSVALVSDAGTPLISDPGYRLVGAMAEAGLRVVPIPGASAVLSALAVSGLATDSFFFAGFLSSKDGAKRTRLNEVKAIPGTLIFYESPRRLAVSLAAMADELGADRQSTVSRELTKTFEEVRRGTLAELAAHYAEADTPKGEIVICVAPPIAPDTPQEADVDALLLSLAGEMSTAKAAGEAAKQTGLAKGDLYKRLLALKDAQA